MFETVHRLGSRIRNSTMLKRQTWLWSRIEPLWERAFAGLARDRGYTAEINGDRMRLEYAYGARYDRRDQRAYEPTFYVPFVSRIREGMTVFDIGAHVGLFSLGAALRVGERGRVVAFEPAPATLRVLNRHVRMNGFGQRVDIEDAVVSDAEGTATFFVYGTSMAASLSRKNVEDLNAERRDRPSEVVTVRALTIDGYCRARGLEPDVLKLDVEGAEFRALKGAHDLLAKRRPEILCEIHPKQMANCGGSTDEFRAYLDELGYRIEPLDSPNPMGIFHALLRHGSSS